MNYIIFNGVDSRTMGVRIERHNNFSTPQRVVESIKVPGRTGNILIDDGSYENIKFDYEFILEANSKNSDDMKVKADEIGKWLHGDYTYKDLTFSNSSKTYKAVVINKIDIAQMFKKFGKALITFEAYEVVSPKAKSILTVSNEDIYTNYTNDAIKPILRVVGEGDCIININNQEIKIKDLEGHLTIDGFNMDCYKEENDKIINCNNKMHGMFPKFEAGENKITAFNCEVEVIL